MTSVTSPSLAPEPGAESPSVPSTVQWMPLESPHLPESAVTDSAASVTAVADAAADLEVIRDLLLKAYPDVVPDLVSGDSTTSLLASVEPAREAYARVLATIQANQPNPSSLASGHSTLSTPPQPPPAIPAGGGAPLPIDPDRLPASEKIRRGLASGRRPA